jgi:hypothetical protein
MLSNEEHENALLGVGRVAANVLRIQEGDIVEMVTFGDEVFPTFGLPRSI